MNDKNIEDLFGEDFEVSCDFLDHAKLRADSVEPQPVSDELTEYEELPEYEEPPTRAKTAPSDSGFTRPRYSNPSPARHTKTVKTKTKKKKKRGLPNLGKPISQTAKAAKSGRKALSRTIGPLLRLASILLIAYILFLLGSRFWNGHSAYGSLSSLLAERNYALGAYLGTGLVVMIYGILSLFWSFTGPKTKEDDRIRKLDTGRGFLFFILIYGGAILSRIAVPLLPSGHSSIEGASAALSIYSGMTGVLFPLCVAGIVCCLLRKYIFN